jgi:hypothetical protein
MAADPATTNPHRAGLPDPAAEDRDAVVRNTFGVGEDCVGESTADDDGCYLRPGDNTATSDFNVVTRAILDAQNHKSLTRSTPLTPGKSYQITWKAPRFRCRWSPGAKCRWKGFSRS